MTHFTTHVFDNLWQSFTTEELLEWKIWLWSRKPKINGHGNSLHWPRNTLYPQRLALTSPTSGSRSVSIVRLRTTAMEFSFFFYFTLIILQILSRAEKVVYGQPSRWHNSPWPRVPCNAWPYFLILCFRDLFTAFTVCILLCHMIDYIMRQCTQQ
jgi:hypothetical protein